MEVLFAQFLLLQGRGRKIIITERERKMLKRYHLASIFVHWGTNVVGYTYIELEAPHWKIRDISFNCETPI